MYVPKVNTEAEEQAFRRSSLCGGRIAEEEVETDWGWDEDIVKGWSLREKSQMVMYVCERTFWGRFAGQCTPFYLFGWPPKIFYVGGAPTPRRSLKSYSSHTRGQNFANIARL